MSAFDALYNALKAADQDLVQQRIRKTTAPTASAAFVQDLVGPLNRDRMFLVASVITAPAASGGQVYFDTTLFLSNAAGGETLLVGVHRIRPGVTNGVFRVEMAESGLLIVPPGFKLTSNTTFDNGVAVNVADVSLLGYLLPRGTLQ